MKKYLSLILLSLAFVACSGVEISQRDDNTSNSESLILKIDSLFNEKMFAHAFWGVKIASLESGKSLYEQNADKLFMPASNEKILTTAAALKVLGPEFHFVSKLDYTGTIENGVLNGDIFAYSNGDPTLYTRFFDSPLVLFKKYAKELKAIGIRRINGNIIGDDSAFEDEHLGYGWAYDGLLYWYSAPFGPLQLNENYIDVTVTPGKYAGDNTELFPNISSSYVNLVNNLSTVDSVNAGFDFARGFCDNDFVFSGELKAGTKSFEVSPTVINPTLFYVTTLKDVLEQEGITIQGGVFDIREYSNTGQRKNLTIYESPALKDIAKGLMKRSQNLYAETFARTSAWFRTGNGSMRNAREIVAATLSEFGLEPGSYRYMDGSGLSRYNYVSPNQLVQILVGMYNSDMIDIWLDALPIAGVDGTLRSRMKNTSAENNVRAKTGTISNVRGLSGYVTDKDGEEYVFSFLINSHLLSSKDTEIITDKVLELIASYSDKKD